MSGPTLFLLGLGFAASMMAAVFLGALRTRNFSIVDIAWSATGIPMTEEQALKSRGDDYRDYQRTTRAFVPGFPKS